MSLITAVGLTIATERVESPQEAAEVSPGLNYFLAQEDELDASSAVYEHRTRVRAEILAEEARIAEEKRIAAEKAEQERIAAAQAAKEAEERRREIAEAKAVAAKLPSRGSSNESGGEKVTDNGGSSGSNGGSTSGSGISVEATFYTAFCDTGCTGVTATGMDVSNTIYYDGLRVIAVDPSVIPLYSIVQVTLANGQSFKAIAGDTGGAIKGRKIDVLIGSTSEARALGRQSATVQILRNGGK